MKKVMFIGGPGNISLSTLEELLERGLEVAVFTWTQSTVDDEIIGKVKIYKGDRNNPEEIKAAFDDFKPDVLVDFICFTTEHAEQLIKIIYGRLKQFVFISTVDVYGYPLSKIPFRESDPWNAPNSQYAADKKACEEIFRSKFDAEKFPLTIVRPAYSMGKRFLLTPFSIGGGRYLIPRLRAGKPVLVPGDGTTLIHPSSAYNTGRMIASITGNEKCIGKSYTAGHDCFMTHDDYIHLIAGVVGVKAEIIHVPTDLINRLDSPEVNKSILNILTRYNLAFSVDSFKNDFPDFKWERSLEETIRQYVEFNDSQGLFADINEEIYEDRIIDSWKKMTKNYQLD